MLLFPMVFVALISQYFFIPTIYFKFYQCTTVVLSSLLAKRCGAGRALTLLNNLTYSSLVTSLGVD
ncbi:MAG: hypothetical protein EBT45_08380, partial [Alphaproteobacteria bacterium]|nr:hypothetical protein [Alphaproteobacteria bacterium]